MKSIFLGAAVIAIAVGLGWYFFGFKNPLSYRKSEVRIRSHVFAVDIADTAAARARGLSGREGLEENEGMLFLFGAAGRYPFWMKDMRFPIDIVWIKDSRVAGLAPNAAPEPEKSMFNLTVYYPPENADAVLELAAGTVARAGIAVGDFIDFER